MENRNQSIESLSTTITRRFLLTTTAISVGSVVTVAPVKGEEPTEIKDWNDLNAVRENLDADYVLMNDLDQSTSGYDEYIGAPTSGWNPIGGRDSFTGTFDGNGHEITGLQINRPDERTVGLFEVNKGNIRNLTLSDLDIIGEGTVGGLVGQNSDEVRGLRASGNITGGSSTGGLVGSNVREAKVMRSAANCDVTGSSFVGGLVGSNFSDVRESWATGPVSGDSGIGGLVGQNVDNIRETWADGPTEGDSWVGGLIGLNDEDGEVMNSWSSGSVSGEEAIGGLVGRNLNEATVEAAYWDKNTSSHSEGVGSDEGGMTDITGLATSEMQGDSAPDAMSELDFETIWTVQVESNDYPKLRLEPTDDLESTTIVDDVPGFGIGSALAGICGATYVFQRRLTETETDST